MSLYCLLSPRLDVQYLISGAHTEAPPVLFFFQNILAVGSMPQHGPGGRPRLQFQSLVVRVARYFLSLFAVVAMCLSFLPHTLACCAPHFCALHFCAFVTCGRYSRFVELAEGLV